MANQDFTTRTQFNASRTIENRITWMLAGIGVYLCLCPAIQAYRRGRAQDMARLMALQVFFDIHQ